MQLLGDLRKRAFELLGPRRSRAQAAHATATLVNHPAKLLLDFPDQWLRRRSGRQATVRDVELQRGTEQSLQQAVVQFPCDTRPLFYPRLPANRIQTRPDCTDAMLPHG